MSVRFRYRAATADGQRVEGVLEAPSPETVIEQLHRRQLYPVSVVEVRPTTEPHSRTRLSWRASVTLWTRVAATLLHAGMPLDRLLAFSAEQETHEGLAQALRAVRQAVQGGASLADALRQHPRFFGPLYVAMVAAGEAAGALDTVLERLADHLEEASELRAQALAALVYPALMATVASCGVIVLLLFVVPRFTAILQDAGGALPASTRALLALSRIVTGWWWLWLTCFAGVGYVTTAALRQPEVRRRWDAWRLGWPVIGDLELKYLTARFSRTLGLLLRSGVPLVPALRIARSGVLNHAMGVAIGHATGSVSEGATLATALSGALPPLALQMVAVGEESGRLEELCIRIADTYDGEVRRAIRAAVSLIEPIMVLVFGAIVGFVALAMLQAIYSINASAF